MARTRKQWSVLRATIRQMLRETVSAKSEWTDAQLLDYWNMSQDMRSMQLAEQYEGWTVDRVTADLVAGQSLYTWPEGAGRVLRVLLKDTRGTETTYLDLERDEHYGDDFMIATSAAVGKDGLRPTQRLMGELIVIEPPPSAAVTGGLILEMDNAPLDFTGDTSKVDLRFPIQIETLLVYDTVNLALAVEDHMGNSQAQDPRARSRFEMIRSDYESWWAEYIALRSQSRTFGQSFYLGD